MADDPLRVFVDTNILVYAHDVSAGTKHERSRDLTKELWNSRRGCVSVQVLQELFVTLTRKVEKPVEPDEARAIVSDLSTWDVCVPDANDVLAAISLHRRFSLSFWDAMIVHCAAKVGCDILYSEDLSQDQAYDGVQVLDPFT